MSVTTRWKKLDSSIPIASSAFAAVLEACSIFSDWPKRVARSVRASLSSSTIRTAVSLVFIVFSRFSYSVGEESAESQLDYYYLYYWVVACQLTAKTIPDFQRLYRLIISFGV